MGASKFGYTKSEMNADLDTDLITRVTAQQHDALAQLYDRHAAQMLAVAMRILKARRDAEDLVHDVFLEVWRKAGDFDSSRGTVRSWILMRVRSRAIDRLRSLMKAREHLLVEDGNETEYAQPGPGPDQMTEWRNARMAVDGLSEPQRKVILLSYFGGFTCREIAERCQIPVGTVKSRLSAAISNLRGALKPIAETE